MGFNYGSVEVKKDGTVVKSGMAAVFYDALEAQERAGKAVRTRYKEDGSEYQTEEPVLPDIGSPPPSVSKKTWESRISAAMVNVKRGWARMAMAMARGEQGVGFEAAGTGSVLLGQVAVTDDSFTGLDVVVFGKPATGMATNVRARFNVVVTAIAGAVDDVSSNVTLDFIDPLCSVSFGNSGLNLQIFGSGPSGVPYLWHVTAFVRDSFSYGG